MATAQSVEFTWGPMYEHGMPDTGVSPVAATGVIMRAVQANLPVLLKGMPQADLEEGLTHLFEVTRYHAANSMTSHASELDAREQAELERCHYSDQRGIIEGNYAEVRQDAELSDNLELPELTPSAFLLATAALALQSQAPDRATALEAADVLRFEMPGVIQAVGRAVAPAAVLRNSL